MERDEIAETERESVWGGVYKRAVVEEDEIPKPER